MRKRIGSRIRMFTVILALALAVTSVSLPPVTAEAAKTVKVRKVQITSPNVEQGQNPDTQSESHTQECEKQEGGN